MVGRVHVIGAGLAGLSAAVSLTAKGVPVTLSESAGFAGGRCRSFYDETLGRRIDNGNHLMLSGNWAVRDFLGIIDGESGLGGPDRAEFPFVDLESGDRWVVRPSAGRLPWWVFSPRRRVPGSRLGEYVRALRLPFVGADTTVAGCLGGPGVLYRRFWEPLAVAVLNTGADEAAAELLWPVLRETLAKGANASRPLMAVEGLSECFVDPALAYLSARGVPVRFRSRLRRLDMAGDRIERLVFAGGEEIALGPDEAVVLAVPAPVARGLFPGLTVPESSRAIVNAHFRLPSGGERLWFVGLIGGVSHWLFTRGDMASVTVSAADALIDSPAEEIARRIWPEVARALGLEASPLSAYRVVKEKRATFAQTPEDIRRRPGCQTAVKNLFLAGDWTDTGLPATIEGSLRSGRVAAATVVGNRS